LIAICDKSLKSRNKMKEIEPNISIFDDYEIMLEEKFEQIQVLTIATRTEGRIDIIEKAVEKKVKAIHVEKPLCNSEKELKRFEKILKNSNTIFTFGTTRRFISPYKKVKESIDENFFGQHNQTIINFGNSLLLWTHIHSLDIFNFIAYPHKAKRVSARLSNLDSGDSKYDIINDPFVKSLIVEYDNGSQGIISNGVGMEVLLNFESGMLICEGDGRNLIYRSNQNKNPYLDKLKKINYNLQKYEGISAPLDVLSKGLTGNKRSIVEANNSIHSGISCQRIAFTAIESHYRNGQFVEIGEYSEDIYLRGNYNGKPV
jgi:scyllo-inositol 2-dehydrogenase (NAD+)